MIIRNLLTNVTTAEAGYTVIGSIGAGRGKQQSGAEQNGYQEARRTASALTMHQSHGYTPPLACGGINTPF